MAYLVGIAGESGSGKGTLAALLKAHFDEWKVKSHVLSTDDCYRDISYISREQRDAFCFDRRRNFDHPDLLDTDKLRTFAHYMKEGRAFSYQNYNFSTHSYEGLAKIDVPEGLEIGIIEGIYALHDEKLVTMYDYTIFMYTNPVLAALRRVNRDVVERGRSFEHVMRQIALTVVPMQQRHAAPTRANADDLIKWEGDETEDPDVIKRRLSMIARQRALAMYEEVKGKLLPDVNTGNIKIHGID
jgi:uridine kinase